MANKVIVRDQITINAGFGSFFAGVNPGETLTLVARRVQHDGSDINLAGQVLSIVADSYAGQGRVIRTLVGGGPGGAAGSAGAGGVATSTGIGNKPGGPGTAGGPGGGGGAAGTVRILARSVTGLHVVALGGPGGPGGVGGNGGNGGNGRIVRRPGDPIVIDGTGGGNGGSGGSGGPGGSGGRGAVAAVTYDALPFVEIAGGPGGSGGPGGAGGAKGTMSDAPAGSRGAAGAPGRPGAVGASTTTTLTEDQYWARVLAELAGSAATWANYRQSVGEYYLRRYNPGLSARSTDLQTAVSEFQAALRLAPGQQESMRLREHVWQNNNVLGFRRDLDVIPHFDEYLQAYTSFGSLVLGFLTLGAVQIIQAVTLDAFKQQLMLQQQETQNRVADAQDQLTISQAEQKDAQSAVEETNKQIVDVTAQMRAAQEAMQHQSISIFSTIGTIAGVVGEVAGAVASVIAAIPTGGASLVALVPDVIALTKTISDNAVPIVQALLKDDKEGETLKKIKDQYGKVGKDISQVVDSTKAVINMINVIEKLAAGSTPDNSKYVALVQRGAELAHELLLRQRAAELAGMRVNAVQASIGRAQALVAATQAAIAANQFNQTVIREAGLRAIRSAQLKLDLLLGFAFRAQRSVEIYTLKSEAANLFLDAGYISPDLENDYREGRINDAQLIAAYSDSWSRLLQPINMQADYLSYFDQDGISSDIRRLSIKDPDVLQAFRTTHSLSFAVNPSDLPPERKDTKTLGVFLAFVGASSPSGIISCQVQHGNRYTQVRPDGSVDNQLLQARTTTLPARTQAMDIGSVVIGANPPLTSPQALSFWGRGVCGRWQVTIPDSEINLHHPDLTNLAEIQVWLAYQFLG